MPMVGKVPIVRGKVRALRQDGKVRALPIVGNIGHLSRVGALRMVGKAREIHNGALPNNIGFIMRLQLGVRDWTGSAHGRTYWTEWYEVWPRWGPSGWPDSGSAEG